MKKIISVVLAAICLSLSPALAAKKEAPSSEKKCVSIAEFEAKVPKTIKIQKKLIGDELKKFNAVVVKHGAKPPEGQDGLIVIGADSDPIWVAVSFSNGCAQQAFPVLVETLKKLLIEMDVNSGAI